MKKKMILKAMWVISKSGFLPLSMRLNLVIKLRSALKACYAN